jgi:hypothetical protein
VSHLKCPWLYVTKTIPSQYLYELAVPDDLQVTHHDTDKIVVLKYKGGNSTLTFPSSFLLDEKSEYNLKSINKKSDITFKTSTYGLLWYKPLTIARGGQQNKWISTHTKIHVDGALRTLYTNTKTNTRATKRMIMRHGSRVATYKRVTKV